jgi:hypothetical protein
MPAACKLIFLCIGLLASTPLSSTLGVSYRVRLPVSSDPKTGASPSSEKDYIYKDLPAKIKDLLSQIEHEESVHSFFERYEPTLVSIDVSNGADKFQIEFRSKGAVGAGGMEGPQLLMQATVPGFVVAYHITRLDGLPVRRELLRFAELLSVQYPGCMAGHIHAQRQESTADEKDKKTRWVIGARLHGKGCLSQITLTIDDVAVQPLDLDE